MIPPDERRTDRFAGENRPDTGKDDDSAESEWRLLTPGEESRHLLETHLQVMDSYREGTFDRRRDGDIFSEETQARDGA